MKLITNLDTICLDNLFAMYCLILFRCTHQVRNKDIYIYYSVACGKKIGIFKYRIYGNVMVKSHQ